MYRIHKDGKVEVPTTRINFADSPDSVPVQDKGSFSEYEDIKPNQQESGSDYNDEESQAYIDFENIGKKPQPTSKPKPKPTSYTQIPGNKKVKKTKQNPHNSDQFPVYVVDALGNTVSIFPVDDNCCRPLRVKCNKITSDEQNCKVIKGYFLNTTEQQISYLVLSLLFRTSLL